MSEISKTFDFSSLPWICQKRFAEICDPKTLKTFASIAASTRRLAKRRHVIDNVSVDYYYDSDNDDDFNFDSDDDVYKYEPVLRSKCQVLCYCDGEKCHGIDISSVKTKFEVTGTIKIDCISKLIDVIECLPFTLNSNEVLELFAYPTDINVLKKLVTPNLKAFLYRGSIIPPCSMTEFAAFLRSLSKLESFE